jgi:hypothetical protein
VPLPPAIVHLIGYPATGKYTVAKAVVAAARAVGTRAVLMDNHASGNLILSVLDGDGTKRLPPIVWERVGEIREIVYRTIEDLSPPDRSYVFTNVLKAGDPLDEAVVERLAGLAAARSATYLPVRLTCNVEALLTRVPDEDRRARHKWIDPDAVRAFIDETELVDLTSHRPLDIDTSTTPPEQSAQRILEAWRALARRDNRAIQ